MSSEKTNKHELQPLIRSVPDLIQKEFGSIIKLAGISDLYEALLIPRVVDEDMGYHFMMSHYLSKDKKYCVTSGTDGCIVLWDLQNRRAERIFKGHRGHVTSVCMTPDNNTIISGGKDKTLRIWERDTGKCRIPDRYMDSIYCLAISNDGSFIASGGKDNIVRLWQLDSGRLIKSYREHAFCVLSISFGPDNTTILSGGADGKCIEWSLFTDSHRLVYEGAHIIDALVVSPDGRYIILGGREDTLCLIDQKSGKILKELQTNGMTVFDVAFSGDSCFAAVCGKPRHLKIYEIPSGVCVKTISVSNEHIHKIDFFENTGSLLSSSGDTALRVWDLNTEKPDTIIKGDTHVIRSIAINRTHQLLAAGTGAGEVKIWDIATCGLKYVLRGHSGLVRSSLFHPQKPYFYTASWDGTIVCWDMTTGQLRRIWQGPGERIYSIYFQNADNTVFAADHNGSIMHLDEDLNVCKDTYIIATNYCYTVSASKRYLVAGSGCKITVRDFYTGHKMELKGHTEDIYSLVLHTEMPLLLSAAMDGFLFLWDVEKGIVLRKYKGHEGRVTFVTVNNNFTYGYSLGTDAAMRQWDIWSGECVGLYTGHTSPAHTGVLIEEKNLFISGGDDGTLCFWDISGKKKGENTQIKPCAALYVYPDHFLWVLDPAHEKREGWFFSDRPRGFAVVKKDKEGTIIQTLQPGDLDRETYLRIYNRPDIVSAGIFDRKKYTQILLHLSKKVHIHHREKNMIKRISPGPENHIP